ncbi:GMP synthase [Pelomicrobium sp. G1]|uniref:GMP synthase n=1 Tax=unclassified Pelomicrobium TaxID=2815318 RepID=UPI003F77725D
MKHFLVVQHTYSEFLGLIETRLEQRDIGFTYVRPFTGQSLPGTALQHDALWLLGGAYPVTDIERQPWIDDELRLIALFQRAHRPVVGLGFGGLLLARAAGGAARSEPTHTACWTRARATEGGRGDPLAQAVDGRRVLVMYNGAVDLPEGVLPLVVDEQGRWIAARMGETAYALLFRPELKPGMLEDMIMEEGRPTPENIGDLLAEARREWPETQETADRVLVALVSALDLMQERRKAPVFSLNVVAK